MKKRNNVEARSVGNTRAGLSVIPEWAGEHLWLVAIALFILSFCIRLMLSHWTGPVVTQLGFPDEIRFLHIARSLAEHGQILVRDYPSIYQKILYPLALAPAFLFTDDQIMQMNIIRVINSLLVSSTVFPVLLLAKKMTSNRTVILVSMLVTVTLSDMVYSAAIFSEVLYLPLVILLFYFAFCSISEQNQSKRLLKFAVLGFVTYITYLTKEIAAAFLIAMVLLLALDVIRDKRQLKQSALSAIVLLVTFFMPFIVMRLTLFEGMGNTYATETHNQITLAAISSPGVFFYLIYSSVVLFVAAVLSFYAAPVFIALFGYSAMNDTNKKIFLFTAFSFMIMIGAIAYTISIREDLGALVPRLHMRFVTPLMIPILVQCLDFLLTKTVPQHNRKRKDRQSSKKSNTWLSKYYPVVIAVFSIAAFALVPHIPEAGYGLDGSTLKSLYPLVDPWFFVGSVHVNMFFAMFKILLLTLTVFSVYLIVRNKTKHVIIALLCTILVVNVYDNFVSYTNIRVTKTSEFSMAYYLGPDASRMELAFYREGLEFSNNVVDSLILVNNHARELDGEIIVFLPGDFSSYADTYLDSRAFPITPFEFMDLAMINGGWVDIAEQPLTEGNRFLNRILELDTWKRDIFSVDYIITLANEHPFANVDVEYENWPFVILQNREPEFVAIS